MPCARKNAGIIIHRYFVTADCVINMRVNKKSVALEKQVARKVELNETTFSLTFQLTALIPRVIAISESCFWIITTRVSLRRCN